MNETHETQNAERAGDALFRLLVDSIADEAIILLDPQGIIMTWNTGAATITGYQAAEIVGTHVVALSPPHEGVLEKALDAATATGRWEGDGWFLRTEGTRLWVHAVLTAVYNPAGALVGVAMVTHQGAAQAQADARRAPLRYGKKLARVPTEATQGPPVGEEAGLTHELVRSNKVLEQFASVAAHDLQEPLRKIQAFGDRLLRTDSATLSAQGRDSLDRMRQAAGRMQTLINDLLAYARAPATAQPFVPVDMRVIVEQVLIDLEAQITHSDARVVLGPLPTLMADALQMRQLWQNLISNALKFRRTDRPPVVRIGATAVPAAPQPGERWAPPLWYRLSVQDNGIGFEQRHPERIFQIFERLHGRSAYEGTGIGLSLCQQIVERHGGTITAHGVPDGGAAFVVLLPAQTLDGAHEL